MHIYIQVCYSVNSGTARTPGDNFFQHLRCPDNGPRHVIWNHDLPPHPRPAVVFEKPKRKIVGLCSPTQTLPPHVPKLHIAGRPIEWASCSASCWHSSSYNPPASLQTGARSPRRQRPLIELEVGRVLDSIILQCECPNLSCS